MLKQMMKKITVYCMCITLLFTMLMPANTMSAYAASSYNIDVGEKINFSFTSEELMITAESSAPSIASLSTMDPSLSSGVWVHNFSITGLSEGTAIIKLYHVFDETVYDTYYINVKHSFDDGSVIVTATCAAEGTKVYTCSGCGFVKEEPLDKDSSNHVGEKIVKNAKAASCGIGYTGDTICSACGFVYAYGETIPAISNQHTPMIDVAKNPTCTEKGLKEGSHCSVCNEILIEQEVVPATGHTEVIDDRIEATETETGLTQGIHCSVCNEILLAQEVIPIKKVSFVHGVVNKDSLIEENVSIDGDLYILKGCTLVISGNVSVNGDMYVFGTLKNQGTLNVNGNLNALHYGSALSAGNYSYGYINNYGSLNAIDLNITNSFLNINIPSGEHNWEFYGTEKVSCESGWYNNYYCTECYAEKYEEIPATGHDWGEWNILYEATCGDDGEKERECNECLKTEYETIPASGLHIWEFYEIQKKSCFADWFEVYECEDCYAEKKIAITPTGHEWGEWYVWVQAKAGSDGTMYRDCQECYAEESKTIYSPKSIKLSKSVYTYDGKVKKPTVKVYDRKNNLIDPSYYTVTYAKGRKNVGKYKVTVKFKKDVMKYGGTLTTTFKINPKATSVTKKPTAAKKAFTLKWSKVSKQATGYEIMYSTSKNFTKKTSKTVKVKSYKTTSKKITGLKAKKTYYVKIRTYKTVNGVNYYSSWSKVKTVKTK